MIATTMPPRVLELRHRVLRWLLPAAAVALAPKCVLCVAAYFGLGFALGLAGPEMCGATEYQGLHEVAWIVAGCAVLGVGALVVRKRCS